MSFVVFVGDLLLGLTGNGMGKKESAPLRMHLAIFYSFVLQSQNETNGESLL